MSKWKSKKEGKGDKDAGYYMSVVGILRVLEEVKDDITAHRPSRLHVLLSELR
jgi:hypothetical protein